MLVVCTVVLSPVMFGLLAATHVKVEGGVSLVNAIFNALPEHIVSTEVLVVFGKGLTVTTTSCESPTQPPKLAVGVTV